MFYLWLKAFHIIAMVAWFAGLFYLPRLFVYHADAKDTQGIERFKVMENRLYYAITWPAAIITTALGLSLIGINPAIMKSAWMHVKLSLVALLWGYHLGCGHYLKAFKNDNNLRTSRFYRLYNEIPTLLLVSIVIMVVVRPI